MLSMKPDFNPSVFSISAAFPKSQRKARPSVQPSRLSPTVTTRTDSRFGLLLQIRPLSSEIIGLFKYDPQRKLDKEQDAKVRCAFQHLALLLTGCRYF